MRGFGIQISKNNNFIIVAYTFSILTINDLVFLEWSFLGNNFCTQISKKSLHFQRSIMIWNLELTFGIAFNSYRQLQNDSFSCTISQSLYL